MNNGLESSRRRLNEKNINSFAYINTLVEEAGRCGLITNDETDSIRIGMYDMLGKLIDNYTGGESTSVMTETAQELLLALNYDIDAYLISLGSSDAALEAIKNNTPEELYYLGIIAVKQLMLETTSLLVKAKRSRITIPCYEYNTALDIKIPAMLKAYDMKFAPHRLELRAKRRSDKLKQGDMSLDYQLAVPVVKARGIYFLKNYLSNLCRENMFCRDFEPAAIAAVYKRYCDINEENYDSAIVNIYSLVLLNAVIADYLKKEHGTVYLSDDDADIAGDLLAQLTADSRTDLLNKTVARLYCGDTEYNIKAFSKMLPAVLNAIENGTLANLLVIG